MKYKLVTSLVLFLFSSHSVVSIAEEVPDPQTLINHMSDASKLLNYDGTFVYREGKQMDTMRIIHKAKSGGSHERLISLTGHGREVIRDDEGVKCYFPENKTVVVEKTHPKKLISSYIPQPVQSIAEFYDFEIAGQSRIAGRDSWIVNVKPNDKYRYGYQLWIDKESKLLLKSELKNQLGVTLEQIMFTQLNVVDDIDDTLLQPGIDADDFIWHENQNDIASAEKTSDKQWQATWKPLGFSMSKNVKETLSSDNVPVEHLVYSDGLAIVSIYIEKNLQSKKEAVTLNIGGVNTYSTFYNDFQVTAVGEVPKATVKQMADSVKSSY